jgi:hypothetical protein
VPEPSPPTGAATWRGAVLAVAWLAYFGVLQWSVVRFRVAIVLTLTACAVLLLLWLATRARVGLTAPTAACGLLGGAAVTVLVPLFTYVRGSALAAGVTVLVTGSLLAAGALALATRPVAVRTAQRWAAAALVVACLAYAVAVAIAVRADPTPRIDVWVTLQQASDAVARGENFYAMRWTGSPGIQDAFTYLPWTAVLVAPGRWLGGDVRWGLGVWMLLAAIAFWHLAPGTWSVLPRRRPGGDDGAAAALAGHAVPPPVWLGAASACWVLLAPGTLTQVDQAWTEPLLLAGLAWWALLVSRGRPWYAVLPLALACASKQHLALLLPVLMLWRPFGLRRTLATGALTGILVTPWLVASPPDFLHDTVTLLVGFHPIRFANTWYLLALNRFGTSLPFWLTGLVVLGSLVCAAWLVWRRQPPLAELLRWLALVLLVANLVNKQAFYNQYWLSGALVALSLAAQARAGASAPGSARRTAIAP